MAETTTKAFADMTDAEKRVAVARDVIAMLGGGTIQPGRLLYLEAVGGGWVAKRNQVGQPLKAVLAGRRCKACALGAMFVACVNRREDIVATKEHAYPHLANSDVRLHLRGVFGDAQMDLIECAFECNYTMGDVIDDDTPEARAAERFGERYKDDADRMRAIMESIVKNDGTFDPTH